MEVSDHSRLFFVGRELIKVMRAGQRMVRDKKRTKDVVSSHPRSPLPNKKKTKKRVQIKADLARMNGVFEEAGFFSSVGTSQALFSLLSLTGSYLTS